MLAVGRREDASAVGLQVEASFVELAFDVHLVLGRLGVVFIHEDQLVGHLRVVDVVVLHLLFEDRHERLRILAG